MSRGHELDVYRVRRMPVLWSLSIVTLYSYFISLMGAYIDHGETHRLMNGRKGFNPLAEAFYLGSCGHGPSCLAPPCVVSYCRVAVFLPTAQAVPFPCQKQFILAVHVTTPTRTTCPQNRYLAASSGT
jgi:hypothetical protein